MMIRFTYIWFSIALFLMTFNLRGNYVSINSILEVVKNDLNISNSIAGSIAAMPSLIFGIFSLVISILSRKLNSITAGMIGIVLISVGIYLRTAFGLNSLFIGTVILSLGITFGNVLFPTLVREYFRPHFSLMSSLNTTNLSVSALLGSLIAAPMIAFGYSWQTVSLVWLVLSIVSFVFWLPLFFFDINKMKRTYDVYLLNYHPDKLISPKINLNIKLPAMYKVPVFWAISICLGVQSSNYFTLVAWIPSKWSYEGLSLVKTTTLITIFQVVAIPFSFIMPVVVSKFKNNLKYIATAVASCYLLTTTILLFKVDYQILFITMVLFGLCSGCSISLLMTLVSMRAENRQRTILLSGMAQSIGYSLSAVSTFLFGFILDQTQGDYFTSTLILTIPNILMIPLIYYASLFKK